MSQKKLNTVKTIIGQDPDVLTYAFHFSPEEVKASEFWSSRIASAV